MSIRSDPVRIVGYHETHDAIEPYPPQPGETCDRCKRKVPHPRTSTSPKSKVSAFRAPAEIVDELKDRLGRLAGDCGFDRLPYSEARTILLLLTIVEAVNRETLVEVASGMSWGTTPA